VLCVRQDDVGGGRGGKPDAEDCVRRAACSLGHHDVADGERGLFGRKRGRAPLGCYQGEHERPEEKARRDRRVAPTRLLSHLLFVDRGRIRVNRPLRYPGHACSAGRFRRIRLEAKDAALSRR
jgi:hypothetical protein